MKIIDKGEGKVIVHMYGTMNDCILFRLKGDKSTVYKMLFFGNYKNVVDKIASLSDIKSDISWMRINASGNVTLIKGERLVYWHNKQVIYDNV